MPIYEYQCQECGNVFELRRPFSEAESRARCPKCGKQAPRAISVFASMADSAIKSPASGAWRSRVTRPKAARKAS